jgi:biopolymer transport protein ExbD
MVRHSLKVDMTPMVDLGFLLITFFVITAELTKPTVMDLYMPKDGGNDIPLGESNALTVLVEEDKIYYYAGKWEDAVREGKIFETNLAGPSDLRKIIGDKQQELDMTQKAKEGRDGLMVIIKPGANAFYREIVDVLDEMTIGRVKKFAIVKITGNELAWLKDNNKTN